jgi:hypothetical protein
MQRFKKELENTQSFFRNNCRGGLMADRRAQLIANLEKNADHSVAFFQSLNPGALEMQVYQEGAGWTVKQVLAHFITIEQSMHWLFENILDGGPGSPENFDVERFNRTQPVKLDGLSFDELIHRFVSVRQETISIVKGMSEDDLDREGRHVFHGHGTLERFIRWAYEHARIHETDIRKKLKKNECPSAY